MIDQLHNTNVISQKILMTPAQLKTKIPLSKSAIHNVVNSRQTIQNILDRHDPRLLVVVGPCSIHDIKAAHEYAERLKDLSKKVEDSLYIVLRAYFEKPRTTTGWKGLVNDPYLDNSFAIEDGLTIARQLLVNLIDLGLPLATEALDPISPQYLQDCISWSAIGARTTESQTHREMASGLSNPVGFKNGTDGSLDVAINALQSVVNSHSFLGINQQGQVAIITTRGNRYGHIVLRGGSGKPNYDTFSVTQAEQELISNQLAPNIMIDCSHANSNKDPHLQPIVLENIKQQILHGNQSIIGVMIESNLHWGMQKLTTDLTQLKYGVSITDGCIDWQTTENCLLQLSEQLKQPLRQRQIQQKTVNHSIAIS